jgi:hypothetical protein
MTRVQWDKVGERRFEAGIDQGVLYLPNNNGEYDSGFAWNGLTTVTESPSGAEPQPQYADNIKYVVLYSYEEFSGTIEAFTYPDEFAECDGTADPQAGITIGQQPRKAFGCSYRTLVGNDTEGLEHGSKIHLIYGATASPSEKARTTINDSPEALNFSWDFTTTPVPITGYKQTSYLTIDSTQVDATAFGQLEDILYGTVGVDPRLPMPDEVLALFTGTVTVVHPTVPTYSSTTDIITIPSISGIEYLVDDEVVPSGDFGPITANTLVRARPTAGHVFGPTDDDDWLIVFS